MKSKDTLVLQRFSGYALNINITIFKLRFVLLSHEKLKSHQIKKQVPDFEDDHQRSYEPNFSRKHQVIHSVLQKAGSIYALTRVSSPYTHVHLPA